MRLIKLTRNDGEPLWVNPEHVVAVEPAVRDQTARATISVGRWSWGVLETPSEVVARLTGREG